MKAKGIRDWTKFRLLYLAQRASLLLCRMGQRHYCDSLSYTQSGLLCLYPRKSSEPRVVSAHVATVCVCVCVCACVRVLRFSERSARRAGGSSAADPLIVAAWHLQRRRYVELLHQKRSEFWTARVDADQSHLRRLWRSFCDLLGSGRSPPPDIAWSQLHHYFDDKVDGVRSATANLRAGARWLIASCLHTSHHGRCHCACAVTAG